MRAATLPSVQAGQPYRIIGFGGSVFDWSTWRYPSNIRRCESCHEQNTGATQAMAHLTRPTRTSCGSCHDTVNFATGEGHVAGPQVSDNQCATCHIPQGELEFDASIRGSHIVPQDSAALSGLVLDLVRVEDASPGRRPIVTFTVKDKSGAGVAMSRLNNLSLIHRRTDNRLRLHELWLGCDDSGVRVGGCASGATCAPEGTCIYTFQRAIPEDARGSFSIGIEAGAPKRCSRGTTSAQNVQYGAQNKVIHFTVDGTPVQPRREW